MNHRPPISAVIPTWHALRYLPACLTALHHQLHPDDEIILVDNASRDHAAAWARQHAPHVRLLCLPHNRGFAGGTNAGIRAARHPLILLCNDDALIEPGGVDALVAALRAHPHHAAAAGTLTFSRHPHVVASGGIRMQRDGLALDTWIGRTVASLPPTPQPVFGASGGLALLRRAALDEVGLFEESFFNYLEDADLAWRLRLRGWQAIAVPAARARHVYSASGSQFKQRLLARNRIRMLIRCVPTPLLRECLPAILRYDLLATAYALLSRQPAILAGRAAALRELPALRQQRAAIQQQRTAPLHTLAAWIEPAPPPHAALHLRRQIARLSRDENV